jgi:hypothetical protein
MTTRNFSPKTLDKYLDFLHFLRIQLGLNDPNFKVRHCMKQWGVNNNTMRYLQEQGCVERLGQGKYRWIGDRPDETMVRTLLTNMFSEPQPKAQPTDSANTASLTREIRNLQRRVDELETIVLTLMEARACQH